MTINNNPRPYILTIFVLMCICVLLLTNKCKRQVVSSNNVTRELIKRDSLLGEVNKLSKMLDSAANCVKVSDSISGYYIKSYRALKKSVKKLPCDSALKIITTSCDSVISKDSVLISSLKNKASLDSLQMANYKSLYKQDSVIIGKLLEGKTEDSLSIVKLNKKLKRQKVLTKVGFITGVLAGGAVGIKLN